MADQAGIQLDPERVSFSSTKTSAKVKISNKFSEHVIIKVKCTSNELFSIRPPVFGMDEGDVSSVNLSCKDVAALEKDKDGHYFMVYYLRAEKEEKKTIRQILAERKGAGQGEFDGKQKIPVGMSGSCEVDKKAKSNENGNGNGKKMAGEARKQSTEDAAKKAAAEEKKKDEKMGEDKKKDEKTAEGTTKKEGSCKKNPKK